MSIGIAAICENGKAAVIAADRQITRIASSPSEQTIRYDGIEKLVKCTETISLAIASNESFATSAIKDEIEKLDRTTSVGDYASELGKALLNCRQVKGEVNFLTAIGADYAHVQGLLSTARPDSALKSLAEALQISTIEVELLVTGWSPHDKCFRMLVVSPESSFQVHDARTPFTAIGSGAWIALPVMTRQRLERAARIDETILAVYEAKKTCEATAGVGSATDVLVMRETHPPQWVDVETLDQIANRHRGNSLSEDEKQEIGALIMTRSS